MPGRKGAPSDDDHRRGVGPVGRTGPGDGPVPNEDGHAGGEPGDGRLRLRRGPCGASDYSEGGGFGINGCGCYIALSADATQVAATAHRSETWVTIRDANLDAKGAAWADKDIVCNYDQTLYPIVHN